MPEAIAVSSLNSWVEAPGYSITDREFHNGGCGEALALNQTAHSGSSNVFDDPSMAKGEPVSGILITRPSGCKVTGLRLALAAMEWQAIIPLTIPRHYGQP